MNQFIVGKCIFLFICVSILAYSVSAQVASGGNFTLDQSVAAGGGGSSSGGNFNVIGTSGQSTAGTQSTASTYTLRGGFWTSVLPPTAASASVRGRVVDSFGRGIARVRITLTDGNGIIFFVSSNPFGYYRFDEIAVGQTYVFSVSSKRYQFVEPTRVVFVSDNIADMNFVAISLDSKN